jgi:hypothetical protein
MLSRNLTACLPLVQVTYVRLPGPGLQGRLSYEQAGALSSTRRLRWVAATVPADVLAGLSVLTVCSG